MEYDKIKTMQYERESRFFIHGYHEEWRIKGKQVAQYRHDKIPFGMEVGMLPNGVKEIKKETTVSFLGKKTKLKKGDLVSINLMPICGRVKR